MKRLFALFAACAVLAAVGLSAPAGAAEDLFTIRGVRVDATGASATEARDVAIAGGQARAWARLFRRLVRARDWGRQPQLDGAALARTIRAFEVANEKRSSTRYLADITYSFNANEVRRLLQKSGIAYSETRAKPLLVVALAADEAGQPATYDPTGGWAAVWQNPDFGDQLVPFVAPLGDVRDMAVLSRGDVAELDWDTLSQLAARYQAGEVLIVEAVPRGGALHLNLTRVTPYGRSEETLDVPMTQGAPVAASYASAAEAAARGAIDSWKERSATDYGHKDRLTASVRFASAYEWNAIRRGLEATPTVLRIEIVGITIAGAQIDIDYYGQFEQLRDALSQHDLALTEEGGFHVIARRHAFGAARANP